MKQEFVVPHRYTILWQTQTNLIDPAVDKYLSMLRFYNNIRRFFFCEHKILTEGVFVTQLSRNAGI